MIEARGLTKRYGPKTAVDGISFTVQPGLVTGFLGPNGAGKSTTMRMIVGLDRPTAGSVTVNGRPYAQHRDPLHQVGALLEARAVHTGRTAFNHLLAQAATHGIPRSRVHEVVEMTGLGDVAGKRVRGFSLGMGQRLGIASALLGDPQTVVLDEPVNGLDPEGVLWVRNLLRYLAGQGRTVFLSSHLMSEMALTADHIIVVGRGRVIADAPVADVVARAESTGAVRVRTPDAAVLEEHLRRAGARSTSPEAGVLDVTGTTAAGVGEVAAAAGVVLHELTPVQSSLEDAYMQLTASEVEYHSAAIPGAGPTAAAGAKTLTQPEGALR